MSQEEINKALLEQLKKLSDKIDKKEEKQDEWSIAEAPFKEEEIDFDKRIDYEDLITKPSDIKQKKDLKVLKTETVLDYLFIDNKRKLLNGIPINSQLGLLGMSGSGKSILMEELAVRLAHRGIKVLFTTTEDIFTSEHSRYDLQSRMMDKAKYLKLEWDKIKPNLFVMDTVTYPELREWSTYGDVYRYTCQREKIEVSLIDSVSMLEAYRGALKYRLMELARFAQVEGITTIFVNQRSEESFDKYDVAGGVALIHEMDSTILIDKGRSYYGDQSDDMGVKRGEEVYMVRATNSRICGVVYEHLRTVITPEGFLALTDTAKELLKKYQ